MSRRSTTEDGRSAGPRHPASEVRLLPPAFVAMTDEQEARAAEALAALLAEAEEQRRAP